MGQVSYGTITITDTNDIESIVIEYARNQSSSDVPESGWSTTRPAWAQGYYIWQRTRTHKAGTDASKDIYGTAVCITGSTGATGATGQSLSSTKTQYTNVASDVTITTSNHTSYTWTDNVPAYNSSKPAYWARITNTYTNPAKTEYLVYKDQGITDAIKTSNDANTTAGQAKTTANEAKEIAQQASTNVTNLQTRTKYFWTNLVAKTGYPVGTYAASGLDGVTFDYENSSTYGYNTLYSNGIKLRYNAINLGELTGTSLIFYNPSTSSQGAKAMELSGSSLKFYASDGTTAQAEFGGTQARVEGQLIAQSGYIGTDTTNRWFIGNRKNYDQTNSAALLSYGNAYIQLGEDGCWRLSTNRLHTGWNASSGSNVLHYPKWNNIYWDFGIHAPTQSANKFIYIRNYDSTDSGLTEAQILADLQDNFESNVSVIDSWQYRFYVTAEGSLYAKNIYVLDDNGNATQIGGTDGVYLLKSGGTITGNLEVNGTLTKSSKNVAYLSETPTSGRVLIADGTGGGIKTSGYTIATSVPQNALFTDEKVQTTKANTTKIYLAGTQTNGTNTGTLNFDEYVYVDTTAGALHATTFNGYTLAAAAAKGVDASMTSTSTSTNLPTTKAVADLIATYLPLAGGTVSGAVDINDELYADSATFGNLIVNGVGRFTNGLYGDLTGNVTGSITGNAATADKVNHNLVIKLASGTTEGTNMFTFNGSAAKTVDITKSALGLRNVENKSSATIRGELTSANVTTALGFTPYNSTNPNGYTSNVGTITGVTAGTGLSGGGTSGTVTLNHSNSVTAQTTQGIYPIKIDAQGHISAYGSAPTTLSGYGITDAKIVNGVITLGSNTITPLTSQWTANLYVGKTATDKANAATTNGNVYLNLVENNTVRNAHKITGSGTTTVTSDADGNITISSADSKTGTVTSITLTQGTGITIGSSGTAITTSGSRTISLADNYGDTKNPYASKTARYVLAAPADAAGAPSFRALTGADVGLGSVLNATQVTGIGQGADGKIRVYKGDSNYEDVAVEIVATESSSVASAQKLTSYGGSTKQPVYFPNSGTNAGKPVAIGYTIETSVPSGAVFTDTTYTFAGSTNGFTVTPLNGTAQTITVTPSITNNVTGSGTSGSLVKWNGTNTVTNGPALGTDTTKFLNNKGEWAVPTNTNTTYTLTNALASHKFTWTLTAGGSGSGSTTTALELVQGNNITLTDDTTNKKITIAAKDTTYDAGTGLSLAGTTFVNTGVTGIKGNSESSYRTGQVNLTPANLGAVAKNDELLTTNPFRPLSMTGPYISKIDNAFYAANKRWNISMTNISGASTSSLFDGSYETNVTIEAGKTSILTMDFSPTTYFPGYPYGYILVSFYYTGIPVSVSGRVYCNYSASGVGWHDISFSPISDSTSTGTTYRSSHQDYYNISQLEITIVGASSPTTKVTQVEMHLDRPDSNRTPFVSKYSAETLYYNLTAPKFIGDLQGKADSATKAGDATCILYPMANNEINFGGTAAKNTIYFGYRTIDNQASPTKYVFSGSTGTANLQCKSIYLGSGTSSYITATDYTGNASTATKWASAQTVYVTLGTASTTTTIQGGSSSAQTIGVNGTLAIGNGGTGLTASPSMLTNLGSTTAANVLQASPRPGITGTLGAANGGTGQTSLINAANSLLNSLSTGSSTPGDNDYYISQYVGGGTTTTTYHRRPMSALWSYISGKISSSNTYVTLATAQTLTAAATKTYLGLQLYGSEGIGFGTTVNNASVTQKANVKYDASLEAIVFSFS